MKPSRNHRSSAGAEAPVVAEPRGCTNFKLRRLARRVTQHYDAEMARSGLKITQYSLLSHVLRLGPVRPGDLARLMTMDASTLTRNLKPLVSAGLLQVSDGPDGRTRSVAITEAGREKRAEAQRRWRVAQDRLNSRLGLERVQALHRLLDESLELLSPDPSGSNDDE